VGRVCAAQRQVQCRFSRDWGQCHAEAEDNQPALSRKRPWQAALFISGIRLRHEVTHTGKDVMASQMADYAKLRLPTANCRKVLSLVALWS
jgi:hypothetical protein